jgi:low affinity Fe/Cu permease
MPRPGTPQTASSNLQKVSPFASVGNSKAKAGPHASKTFSALATWLSRWLGSVWAILVAAVLIAFGLATVGIGVTTLAISIATLLMVFALQNTENKDSSALQVKLDEIITHLEGPRDHVAGIHTKSHEEIAEVQAELDESREASNAPAV